MSELGIAVMWCIAQVTVLALVAIVVYAVIGRFVPRIRGSVALTSLVCIVPLSAFALSPWPRWSLPELPQLELTMPEATQPSPAVEMVVPETARVDVKPIAARDIPSDRDGTNIVAENDEPLPGSSLDESFVGVDEKPFNLDVIEPPAAAAVSEISVPSSDRRQVVGLEEVSAGPVRDASTMFRFANWGIAVLIVFGISLAVGLLRLAVGIAFVRAQRRRATFVEDPELLELVDILCAEAGGTRWVDVRESSRISTAATIGWRRPMILLPIEWRTWTAEERRVVLAHEIAHIRNRDFIAWLWAQLGLSLHFYHPLVHWLVGRLRLEQELAADALAAPLAGGPAIYLNTLAAMALRQSERPLNWPARAFLPTRDTLLRRIEMLKRPQAFSKSLFSRPVRYAAIALVLCAGMVAAGLRAGGNRKIDQVSYILTDVKLPSGIALEQMTLPLEQRGGLRETVVESSNDVPLQSNTENSTRVTPSATVEVLEARPDGPAKQMKDIPDRVVQSEVAPFTPPADVLFEAKSDADKKYVETTTQTLRQIAAALRKYRAVHGEFPKPIVKTATKQPHSWRVALLPFFEGGEGLELYEQYNFEEPWDGPTNSKLLVKMPAVYRTPIGAESTVEATTKPGSAVPSIATSYYMLTGPLFERSAEEGGRSPEETLARFQSSYWGGATKSASSARMPQANVAREESGGTQLVIMESRRSTPWTKPSDVLFDPEGSIEQLAGYHAEAMPVLNSLGNVSFLRRSAGHDKLIAALTKLDSRTIEARPTTNDEVNRGRPSWRFRSEESGKAKPVTDATFAAEVEQSPVPVMLLFHTPRGTVSQKMLPTFAEVAAETGEHVRFRTLDADEATRETLAKFEVKWFPTLVLISNGELITRSEGLNDKQQIQKLLSLVSKLPRLSRGTGGSAPLWNPNSSTNERGAASENTSDTKQAFSQPPGKDEDPIPVAEITTLPEDFRKALGTIEFSYSKSSDRKSVGGIMIGDGDNTLIVVAGPATLHPKGIAVERAMLNQAITRPMEVQYDEGSIPEVYVYRAKAHLTHYELNPKAAPKLGDKVTPLVLNSKAESVITADATVTALNQSLEFMDDRNVRHRYAGLTQIDRALPEGTRLLKNGELSGIVLGSWVTADGDASLCVPVNRIAEVCDGIRKNLKLAQNDSVKSAASSISEPSANDADSPGTFSGRIVFEGSPPKLPPLVKKGESVPHLGVVSADIPDERLVIGPKNGIANVFVYLQEHPAGIPFEIQVPPPFGFIGDRFVPHAMIVPTNKPVRFTNPGAQPVNIHTFPMKNNPFNMLVASNDPNGIVLNYSRPERLPIAVKSDLHAWALMYQLPLDHPYAAVTRADGSFEIRNLPPGQHHFKIWHEALRHTSDEIIADIGTGKKIGRVTLKLSEDRFDLPTARTDVSGVGVNSDAGATGTVEIEPSANDSPNKTAATVEVVDAGEEKAGPPRPQVPALAGVDARKAQSRDNIKHLLLAMHNYHEVHKHFPPAVVIGPDGKTPHSWRVELLPFLESAKLYEQYKMDEPWDGPNNKKLLAQMPAVFRAPGEPMNSTTTSYFVPTGPQTLFHLKQPQTLAALKELLGERDAEKRALTFRDVADGTSNTVAVIETKRDVPWTRPQDIDCDPKIPLPKFGRLYDDSFHVGLSDGSATALRKTIDEKSMRALLSRDGGERINLADVEVPNPNARVPVAGQPEPVRRPAATMRRPGGLGGGLQMENAELAQSRNKIKLLMLAIHNYHDVHNHFPPAVGLGPDGKTPHSWRVAILPYLMKEGANGSTYHDLYEKYRFDEPWDGPNNKQLLAQMPEAYRAPNDKPDSTNTAYLAIASQYWKDLLPKQAVPDESGKKGEAAPKADNSGSTVFDGLKGVRISEITDGTSNTIAIVESQLVRQIAIPVPWTEPDDIVYDPAKPLPVLAAPKGLHEGGGGYFAGMSDGSAHFLRKAGLPEKLQRALLTRAGGEPIGNISAAQVMTRTAPAPAATPANAPAPTLFERLFGRSTTRPTSPAADDDRTKLKMLLLAMHNYHDVHGHFPPAVVMGPDGKTPHSWRVELLPFLEGPGGSYQTLFNQYRMDEPWDGPNNKKLIEQMPHVYRTVGDEATSTSAKVFVLTGGGSMFDQPKGTKISEVKDGTSMTIALIATVKIVGDKTVDVPWSKPEDIEYDPKKPLQKFGTKGGNPTFLIGLADGSVRPIPVATPEETLRKLITRDGKEIIQIPD